MFVCVLESACVHIFRYLFDSLCINNCFMRLDIDDEYKLMECYCVPASIFFHSIVTPNTNYSFEFMITLFLLVFSDLTMIYLFV